MADKRLTDDQHFVNVLREVLGLPALYSSGKVRETTTHGYSGLERMKRAADPSCKRCCGSGYYDGERFSMYCPCTGLRVVSRKKEAA